jgi:hypothetical protein
MRENQMNEMKRALTRGVVGTTALGLSLGFSLGCDGQADPSYEGEPLVSVSGQVEAPLSVGDVEVGVLWLTSSTDLDIVCTGESTPSREQSACIAACGEVTCETLESWADCAANCPDSTEVIVNARPTSIPFLTGAVGVTTPAVGEFPAQFSLDILEPPPAEALIRSVTGEQLALGLLIALDPAGAPFRVDLSRGPNYPDWVLGGSETHLLGYAPNGVSEGSLWSQLVGLTLAPGYHLMEVLPAQEVGNEAGQADEENGPEVREVPGGDASNVLLRIAPPEDIAWPLELF